MTSPQPPEGGPPRQPYAGQQYQGQPQWQPPQQPQWGPPQWQSPPPPWQPGPTPPRKSWPARHKLWTAVLSIVGLFFVLIIIGVAIGSGPNTAKLSTPPASPAAAAPAATVSPTPSPTAPLSGPVGTVYSVTDYSGNKMDVTLVRVIDPAQGADQFSTPNNGFRFIGVVFRLKGVSGTFSDDANTDATVIGTNGQSYTADFNSIARYTNFNNGSFNLTPGQRSVGAVTFQVPIGVKVASVQWSGTGGFGGSAATWAMTP